MPLLVHIAVDHHVKVNSLCHLTIDDLFVASCISDDLVF